MIGRQNAVVAELIRDPAPEIYAQWERCRADPGTELGWITVHEAPREWPRRCPGTAGGQATLFFAVPRRIKDVFPRFRRLVAALRDGSEDEVETAQYRDPEAWRVVPRAGMCVQSHPTIHAFSRDGGG